MRMGSFSLPLFKHLSCLCSNIQPYPRLGPAFLVHAISRFYQSSSSNINSKFFITISTSVCSSIFPWPFQIGGLLLPCNWASYKAHLPQWYTLRFLCLLCTPWRERHLWDPFLVSSEIHRMKRIIHLLECLCINCKRTLDNYLSLEAWL